MSHEGHSLELYSFEDGDGAEQGFTTRDIDEAKRYARANRLRLIANVFEFSETELVEDNTGTEPMEEDDDESTTQEDA